MITEDYKCWFGLYNQAQRQSILQALGPGPLKKPAAVRQQIISWLTPWAHFFTLILDARNIVKADVQDQSGGAAAYGYYTPLSDLEDQDANTEHSASHDCESPPKVEVADTGGEHAMSTQGGRKPPRSRKWADKPPARPKPPARGSQSTVTTEKYCVRDDCYINVYAKGVNTMRHIRPDQDVREEVTRGIGRSFDKTSRLYLVNESNLTRRITPSCSLATYAGVKADNLSNGNKILVRSSYASIEPIQDISYLGVCNGPTAHIGINLMHIYRGFRSVRGDGECWYRCVGFYVVESALTNRTNWDRLTSRLRCTPRLVSHLQQSDRENFEQGLRWLDRISCDATYDICQLEEDLCTGLSQGVPTDIDLFITQSVTLNCIEAIELADLPLQTLICAEHGGEYVTDDLDKLYTHVLYGKDISGHRIWATEHVGKLGMYSRFGLSAQVETMLFDSTQTIDVQEPQDDTVAHIVLFHHHNHYDILYADESGHDYKQVWKVSCCMDEYRTRLLGPYPDRRPQHKYLSSAIIDETLSYERRRSASGVHIFDSSLGDAMHAY